MIRIEHAPKWLGVLTLPLAAAALACTPGTSARETSSAPPPPTSVSAGGLGKCNSVEFAAALGLPTPAPEDVSLPPNIAAINVKVRDCDASITDPEKDAYRGVMRLVARDQQATPAPAGPEQQRVIPGLAGGGAPDLPVPSATPRPPELTATIPVTLPDGTKATATLPPFTATLVPTPTVITARPLAVPSPTPDAEFQALYAKVTAASKSFRPNRPEEQPAWEKQMHGLLNEISLPNSPTSIRASRIGVFWGALGSTVLAHPQNPDPFCDLGRAYHRVTRRPPYSTYITYDPKDHDIGGGLCNFD